MINNVYDPATRVPESGAAYTWITRARNGQIKQLDTYIPEVLAGEECVGIDFKALLDKYPDLRIARMNTFADRNYGKLLTSIGGESAFRVPAAQVFSSSYTDNSHVFTTKRASVLSNEFFAPIEEGIVINQRFGTVNVGALAVAVSLPD